MKKLKQILLLTLITLIISGTCLAQNKVIVSGYINDGETGERLAGATIYSAIEQKGASCNNYGFFSLILPAKSTELIARFVGYEAKSITINIEKDTIINIYLFANNVIGEVEVKASAKEDFLLSPTMSMHQISAKDIGKIPAALGEPDVLKAIQLLPGVFFAQEGNTGFSVRGGNPDQTLILLDGVPVYNVNHLWGFMSLFNNDAIKGAKLYKGGLPARFGGRLSSVLDISMKEGNIKKKSGTFSISPIAARYTFESPIVKDKASFMLSARRTWLDALLQGYQRLEGQNDSEGAQLTTYGFWDINAKANWIINQNNRLYLSFYTGKDAFIHEDKEGNFNDYLKFSYNWQNLTSVLRWNHAFNPSLFANFSFYNSQFKQEYSTKFENNGKNSFIGYNKLNDISAKGDFDWYPSFAKNMKFGYKLSLQKFSPEIISIKDDSTSIELNKDIFTENLIANVYAEGEFDFSEKLTANIGARIGFFSANKRKYFSFQPRVSMRYLISNDLSGKISYSRMKQYLHQLQNTTLGIPTELWVSSTKNIKPGTSNLYSAGLFYQPSGKIQFSTEIYYSSLQNLIKYKQGIEALKERGESWEDYITSGNGKTCGIEFMAEKKSGIFTGWISYTLSRSTRQFDEINFGNTFPYAYDRRHQLSVYTNLFLGTKSKKGRKINTTLSTTFNFASGNNITLATQEYQAIPLPFMEGSRYSAKWFSKRSLINQENNFRMPNFHNLSISYNIERKLNGKSSIWNFSIYNVYNRRNPWYYYKKSNQIKQVSIFPIMPSISFTYKW